MKKLLYLSAIGLVAAGFSACESEPTNPGDFSLKSELEVERLYSVVTGETFPLKVARAIDTTYRYSYLVYDTVKDASGEPVIGTDGKYQITSEEHFYDGKITAKFVEYEPVVIPSYADLPYDTLKLEFASNASWVAPVVANIGWYSAIGSSTIGGDGALKFSVRQFAGAMSKNVVEQVVYTRDSTCMYRFYIKHSGLTYTGE